MAATFTVHRDPFYGFIVADAAIGAKSFAMVPARHDWAFQTKAEAEAQADYLTNFCGAVTPVPTRMIETPERFEEVADTLYGPAWD